MSNITLAQANQVCDLIRHRSGINIGDDQVNKVCQVISEILAETGFSSFDDYYDFIKTSALLDTNFRMLLERLVIGETYFFRDEFQFQALRKIVIPKIIEEKQHLDKTINILCAGCSSGEEPYSLAILLHEMLVDRSDWRINLIGADISLTALAKAQQAIYSKWSFRGVDEKIIDRYFSRAGNFYKLCNTIKKMVNFQHLNLAENLPFTGLDLILCRNVFIYLSFPTIEKVSQNFFNALRDGGWLIVGACELSQQYFHQYEPLTLQDTILYYKRVKSIETEFIETIIESNVEEYYLANSQKIEFNQQPFNELSNVQTYSLEAQSPQKKESPELIVAPDAQQLYLQAKIEANRGNLSIAEELCRRYLEIVPDAIEAIYLLALIYQGEERITEATKLLHQAVFLNHNFIMGHWSLGLIYNNQGNGKAVRYHFTKAKKLLNQLSRDEPIPHSEGQTAARLLKAVEQTLQGTLL